MLLLFYKLVQDGSILLTKVLENCYEFYVNIVYLADLILVR